jgi:hypothetical protein
MFSHGCKEKTSETGIQTSREDTLHMIKIRENLFIKNPERYSEEFIYELELGATHDSSHSKLQLIDSMIIYNNDTSFLPNQIDTGRSYCFIGISESERYQLKLKRINLTDIDYEYIINERPDGYHKGKGTMSMELYGLINKSITYDNIQDLAKDFIKYTDNINDGYFYIYVEKNNKNKLHAVVSRGTSLVRPPFEERTPILEEQ